MSINMKFIALGSAGVVALAGAGVYAGTLTTTTSGKVGAGTVAIQGSCAADAIVTPGLASWNATNKRYEYTTLELTRTSGNFSACDGQYVTANVHNKTSGTPVLTTTTRAVDSATDQDTDYTKIVVTFAGGAGLDAGLAEADNNYGLVFQTKNA